MIFDPRGEGANESKWQKWQERHLRSWEAASRERTRFPLQTHTQTYDTTNFPAPAQAQAQAQATPVNPFRPKLGEFCADKANFGERKTNPIE